MKAKILNSRDKKRLALNLAEEYGVSKDLFAGLELYQIGGEIWAASRDCLTRELPGVRIDSAGLQVMRAGKPTIHGIQLLFKSAELTELTPEEAEAFIRGETIGKKGLIASYRRHPLALAKEKDGGMARA